MNSKKPMLLKRLLHRVFPRTPDFHGLLSEQCDLAVEAMTVFVEFMQDGDPETGNLAGGTG